MPSVKRTILPLTSVRFFAALYVVIFHTLTELVRGVDDPNSVSGGLLGLGYISVSFFFVLSGFILSLVYLDQLEVPDKTSFWVARFARIYPLFVITLLLDTPHSLFAAVRHLGFHAAIVTVGKTLLANILLLQAWLVNFRGIDNPNWSLSVEAFFYAVFPLLAILLIRRRFRTLLLILAGSYVVGLALIAGAAQLHMGRDSIKFSPLLHLHEFVEGICAGLLISRLSDRAKRRIKALSPYFLLSSVLLFAGFIGLSYRILNLHLFIHDGMLSPLFLLVIVSLTYGDSLLHRALSYPRLVLLGEASYGLYLIHIPLWHLLKPLPKGHSFMTYPLFLAAAIGLSILSFYYLERPSRRFILKSWSIQPKETMVSGSIMQ